MLGRGHSSLLVGIQLTFEVSNFIFQTINDHLQLLVRLDDIRYGDIFYPFRSVGELKGLKGLFEMRYLLGCRADQGRFTITTEAFTQVIGQFGVPKIGE